MTSLNTLSLPLWAFPALFCTGLAAGFVDSVAGGGGLITLPVLLSMGLPPVLALGTNKLQSTFGSASATWHYQKSKVVSLRDCGLGVFFTLVGGTAGTLLVQQMDPGYLRRIIPIVLLGIVAYMFFRPQLGEGDSHPRVGRRGFYVVAGLVLGFYDGFFGPGVGSFWAMAFMLGLGFNLTKATGYTKVMNFTSNVASFLFFALGGHIHYVAGFAMGAGQLVGARLGSRMVITRGTQFIRPIFITMVLAITLKVAVDAYLK